MRAKMDGPISPPFPSAPWHRAQWLSNTLRPGLASCARRAEPATSTRKASKLGIAQSLLYERKLIAPLAVVKVLFRQLSPVRLPPCSVANVHFLDRSVQRFDNRSCKCVDNCRKAVASQKNLNLRARVLCDNVRHCCEVSRWSAQAR